MHLFFNRYPIIHKFYKFFITSGVGWLVDFSILWILVQRFSVPPFYSSVAGSTVGNAFVFFASLYKIFVHKGKFVAVKLAIYLFYSILLLLTVSFLIQLMSDSIVFNDMLRFCGIVFMPAASAAKIILTPFSLILNFFAMGLVVEKIKF